MSWDYDDDEAKRRLRRWFGDFIPEDMLKQIEEMMERMMSEMSNGSFVDPEVFEEMLRNQEGTNPFLFGFSVNIGPDGKPIMKRFGNKPSGESDEHLLEPLVDIVEEDGEIVVVAEVPGVERDEIKVRIKGTTLTIHADNPDRPYHKEIELPSKVKKDEAKSAIRNGVLEVRLKKE
ncbi:MAG: Hsp20/alpha crystallin family protein [Candidatus Thorarchaeota archaeon]|nr:Hsp20/alpha crystallin family protein [Candidatus Thorarchaeota archaeon]